MSRNIVFAAIAVLGFTSLAVVPSADAAGTVQCGPGYLAETTEQCFQTPFGQPLCSPITTCVRFFGAGQLNGINKLDAVQTGGPKAGTHAHGRPILKGR
jgi:hypothetical protein